MKADLMTAPNAPVQPIEVDDDAAGDSLRDIDEPIAPDADRGRETHPPISERVPSADAGNPVVPDDPSPINGDPM